MTFQFRADLTETGTGVRDRAIPDGRAAWCDDDAMSEHAAGGFAAEARIDTPYGPVPAGMLRPGHRVLTRDAGPQTVRWVGHRRVAGTGRAAPVQIPSGTLGASSHLRLSQHHRMLVPGPAVDGEIRASGVLVPVVGLLGKSSIHIASCDWVTYVHVLLEAHHVISAEGVACDSLLMGPISNDPFAQMPRILPDGEVSAIRHQSSARPVLSVRNTREMLV